MLNVIVLELMHNLK